MHVGVLGGGVSGLTCAVALRLRGHDVALWAERLPPHTTSSVAAAFWYPYRAEPPQRVAGWARLSHARFMALAEDPTAGITVRRAVEILRHPAARPAWADAVSSFAAAGAEQLPAGISHGWVFDAPVIDTRVYLPFLRAWFERLGGVIHCGRIDALGDVPADVLVNCTGLGSRTLCNDDALFPIRGQLVHVADPGIESVLVDEDDPRGIAYVVPRGDDCVLGGTAEFGNESVEVDLDAAASILARCAALDARLVGAVAIGHAVGLRPGRAAIRLEPETLPDGRTVVHDYGHGGAGVTLSWGCADEVCTHVDAAAR